jgi:MFS family permease
MIPRLARVKMVITIINFNTTTAHAQLTLSFFMIGLGIGNLFVGPISDSLGRKNLK